MTTICTMQVGTPDCFGFISIHLKQGFVGNGDRGDIIYFRYRALIIFHL